MAEIKIQVPPALNVNYMAFGKFFKMLLEDIIKGTVQISNTPSRAKLDAELRHTLIKGFHGVDLSEGSTNAYVLQEMIEKIWTKIDPVIRQQVKDYSSKFKKTIL